MINELPGSDDLPPGCLPSDIDVPEPEQLLCRQCGRRWDEPRLSPDGVCPLCLADLEER